MLLLGVLAAAAVAYLQSDSFREELRQRIVSELEQRLGARIVLRDFQFSWLSLTAHLDELTIDAASKRAEQPADSRPFFSARSIDASWHLLSIFPLRADFDFLQVAEPRLNVKFFADGSNNIPSVRSAGDQAGRWAEQLIRLRMGRFEMLKGEVVWEHHRIPLAMQADDFELNMKFAPSTGLRAGRPAEDSYSGTLAFQNGELRLRDAIPAPLAANLEFKLLPHRAEFSRVRITASRSAFDGSVSVNDLRALNMTVNYDARLNWADVGNWLGMRGWQGDIRSNGEGRITAAATELDGDLAINTVRTGVQRWEHIPWNLSSRMTFRHGPGDDGAAETSANLANVLIGALGGTLRGGAQVTFKAAETLVSSRLALEGAQFSEVASALRFLPVDLLRLPWATAFSGPVEITYLRRPLADTAASSSNEGTSQPSGPDLKIKVELAAAPPANHPPSLTPVSGSIQGIFLARSRRLEDVRASFDLPGTRLSAEGWMQESASDMSLQLETSNLAAIRPATELFWRGFGALPIKLEGEIKAQSHWTGGWHEPAFRGPVTLTGFSYGQTRWDVAGGTVEIRRKVIEAAGEAGVAAERHTRTDLRVASGRVRQGRSASEFALSLDLRDGRFLPESSFQASGELREFDVALIQVFLNSNVPLAGTVNGRFNAAGTRQSPRGRASVSMTDGSISGEPFEQLATDIEVEPGPVIRLNPVRITKGGVLTGTATIRPEQKQFQADFKAERLPLDQFAAVKGMKFPINGVLDGHVAGGGSFDAPVLTGEFRLSNAGVGPLREGELQGTFQTRDKQLNWTANGALFDGEILTTGQAGLSSPYPLSASVDLRNGQLRTLYSVAQGIPEGLEGAVSARANIRGNGADAGSISAEGELSSAEIARMGVAMRTSSPAAIHYQNQQLRVDGLHLVGDQVDLTAGGTIRTSADPAMSLRATGTMDLAALSKLDPQVTTQGRAELDAQISGTFRRPLWRGRLSVQDASAQFGRLANSLSAIRGTIVFDGTRGDLEGFRAESGGGEILITGGLRYGEGSGLQFNLNGAIRNVRVRYPEALSTWIDGQVNWSGSIRSSLLEGRVTINRHSIAPPNDLAQVLFGRRRGGAQPLNSPFLQNLRLNLGVTSAPEVRLDTRTARNLQTAVDARIQGTGAQPAILGRIGVLSGEIDFAGKRYSINRGEVTFLNPFRFEPVLNLNVQARVQQYDITMDFSGPPDRVNVTYRSDPPLPTRDILALLVAGGSRPTSLQPSSQPLPQVTADSLLSQALSSQIGSRLDRIFGNGRVRVDPQLNTVGGSASATIALEQQIRNNITLLYATDVSSAQQQYVQGEWIISPKLSVVGIRDRNGLVGVNFQITLRFE